MAQDELTGFPNELEEQASALTAWFKEFNLHKGLPLDDSDLAVIFSRLSFSPDAAYPIFGKSQPTSEGEENNCPTEATVKGLAEDFTGINHKEDGGGHIYGFDELVKLRDAFFESIRNLSAEELEDMTKFCKQHERDLADHGIIVPPLEATPSESAPSQ